MSDVLTQTVQGHVAQVELNRPDMHNAVNLELFEALAAAASSIATNRSVRAVVLCAAGDNFCSGIDTGMFGDSTAALTPSMFAPGEGSPANMFQGAAYAWRELPVPVICAIQGVAFGAGLQIALGADLRYAAPDARLSIMEIEWGLIPDMAITTTLRDVMPADAAKELAWSGRIVAAEEALRLGLLTGIQDDPLSAAMDKAGEIAARSPEAVRAIKQLFDSAWRMKDADALQLEARLQAGIIGSPNQLEAVMAKTERRAPEFKD
ncbi:MAG: crotonase/enoyl-CoA hydratase family protein [Woeseiaceae bacterium]|nr:crotonase/enoyl-CoA hydratase family protein [Woeseiaceae bacterium]